MANDVVKTKAKSKGSKGHKREKREGSKVDLKEQVLSMGGEESDVEMLRDVKGDTDMITGEQGNDVRNALPTQVHQLRVLVGRSR